MIRLFHIGYGMVALALVLSFIISARSSASISLALVRLQPIGMFCSSLAPIYFLFATSLYTCSVICSIMFALALNFKQFLVKCLEMLFCIFCVASFCGIVININHFNFNPDEVTDTMSTAVKNYATDKTSATTLDYIQKKFKCCGALNPDDWERLGQYSFSYSDCPVPLSCAKNGTCFSFNSKQLSITEDVNGSNYLKTFEMIFGEGCSKKVTKEIILQEQSILKDIAVEIAIQVSCYLFCILIKLLR